MATPRILVVDDEPLLRRVVSRMVNALGCEAVEAEGLRAARTALAIGAFAAVLSDIALGDGSGLDLAAELVTAGSPPIALMSGSPEALEQAAATLGLPVLSKPITGATLRATLLTLGVALPTLQPRR